MAERDMGREVRSQADAPAGPRSCLVRRLSEVAVAMMDTASTVAPKWALVGAAVGAALGAAGGLIGALVRGPVPYAPIFAAYWVVVLALSGAIVGALAAALTGALYGALAGAAAACRRRGVAQVGRELRANPSTVGEHPPGTNGTVSNQKKGVLSSGR